MAKRGPKVGTTKVDLESKKNLDKITLLISQGVTEASVAKSFGYSAAHFSGLKKKFPKLEQAIKDGRESIEQLVYDKLFMMMSKDDHPKQFNALVFYAKCQLGWNDRQDNTPVDQPQKTTSLTFVQS